mgnify:CR=1 FL=1
MKLDSQIKHFTKISLDKANSAVKRVTKGTMEDIIRKTAVDTGLLVNNWITSKGNPEFKVDRLADESASDSLQGINDVTKNYTKKDWGMSIWMTNSLHYANAIEMGTRSKKSPQGMLRISVLESPKHLKK